LTGPEANVEREIKLRFESPEHARREIQALGAQPLRPRRLQADTVYDTPDRRLSSRAEVLRLRADGGTHCITFKSPVSHPTMKLREEFETGIGDGTLVGTILARLGFVVAFRYEKYREEFSLSDVVVAIDETPVGTFVEIEGSDAGILAVASALGRDPSEFVIESYRALFVRACEARGVAATDMLFSR
jgi:adenylate cyclase class 2